MSLKDKIIKGNCEICGACYDDLLDVSDVKEALLKDSENIKQAMHDIAKHLRESGVDNQVIMDVSLRLSMYIVCQMDDVFGDFEDE